MYIITRTKGVVKNYFKISFRILMSNLVMQKEMQIWNLPHLNWRSRPEPVEHYRVAFLEARSAPFIYYALRNDA